MDADYTRSIPSSLSLSIIPQTVLGPFGIFWQHHPAFLYGLACLWGCLFALSSQIGPLLIPIVLILITFGYIPQEQRKNGHVRLLLASFIAISAYTCCWGYYRTPMPPPQGIEGKALISIQSLSDSQSTFGPTWILKGSLQAFIPEGEPASIARGVPYRMTIPATLDRIKPAANTDYWVTTKLRRSAQGIFHLTPTKEAEWWAVAGSWSLADLRYRAKGYVSRYIHENVTNERSANLLVGLLTGDFSDRQTRLSLGRFGLQHILAISGFHFALLAAVLSMLLSVFLPIRWCSLMVLLSLSLYYLFLGYGPSISRAYITIAVVLLGQLFCRQSRALNSLGIAMLVVLAYDPAASLSPAFQLSFLATAAILLLYQPVNQLLATLWRTRSLSKLVEMSTMDQHGYVLLALTRQALALSLAVHLVTVPVSLYYFQKFPLLSLIFNVFFPFLISVSILLLIAGAAAHLILPWLSGLLHQLNTLYTKTILNLTFNAPIEWDLLLRTDPPSVWILSFYLSILIAIGIWLRHPSSEDLAF